MTSIGRPELSRTWWESACPEALDSKLLKSALTALERAEGQADGLDAAEGAALLGSSLGSVAKALERTRRECDRRSDGDVIAALSELAKQVARRIDDLESKESEEDESADEDSEDALLDVARARKLMRRLPKGPMPFAFGVGEGGATYLALDRSRKGASLMSKLKDASGCNKATFGIASVEGKELCLDVHGPKLGSMRQRVREFLRENQPMPYAHVRVNSPDQDDEGDDEPSDVEPVRPPNIEQTEPIKRYALGEDSDVEEPVQRYALGEDSEVDEPKRYALGEDSDEREERRSKRAAPNGPAQPREEPPAPAPQDDPPLNMVAPYGIAGSVGAGGKNHSDDVQAVQTALNRRGAALEVDGQCGPKTIAAIRAFQKLMGFANPDGLITPGQYTDRAL